MAYDIIMNDIHLWPSSWVLAQTMLRTCFYSNNRRLSLLQIFKVERKEQQQTVACDSKLP